MRDLSIDAVALLPALFPVVGLLVVLVADLVAPRLSRAPWALAATTALGVVVSALVGLLRGGEAATFCLASTGGGAAVPVSCFWKVDALGGSLQLAAGLAALVSIGLAWPRSATVPGQRDPGVVHVHEGPVAAQSAQAVLLLGALAGTVVVAASRDIGTLLVALELATLPVIVLVALSGRRGAVAGAVQLLVTSVVSFALLVLGLAVWFAATGSPFLDPDAALLSTGANGAGGAPAPVTTGLLSLAVVLVLAGIGFKLSLVPFHAWTPTTYAGTSTAVATFLATVSKIAALAALLVVVRAVAVLGTPALLAIAVLAGLSMTVGNVMALRQDDVVRLLAWSTVAQAGWVVLPLVSLSALGARASATYLLTYVTATLVAFAVVALTVAEHPRGGRRLTAYDGMWRRHPVRAGALALALTSLAGLPPGVIGLVGKVVALRPVVAQGWLWLAVVAAVNAVLGVAVYLRWLRPVVSLGDPETQPVAGTAPDAEPGVEPDRGRRRAVVAALVLSAAVLVVVSVQPDLLLGLLG
ncbi:MAG: proton-conducting transporter membrane subunit [Terracoccus sp.]